MVSHIHIIGIRHFRSIGQVQIRIGQFSVGICFVLLSVFLILLFDLLVVFDNFLVIFNDFLVGLVDSCISLSRCHAIQIQINIAFLAILKRIAIVLLSVVIQLGCIDLSGKCNRHRNCHCESATCLGQ